MKNHLILVVTAAPDLIVGDITYNTEEIIRLIRENAPAGVIVFPELSVTGYTCADLFLNELLLEEAETALVQIAKATENLGVTAVVGVPVRFENHLYNCGAVLSGGEVKALIPKSYLPNYSEFYECRWFVSGRDLKERSVCIAGTDVPFGTDVLAEDPVTGTCCHTPDHRCG